MAAAKKRGSRSTKAARKSSTKKSPAKATRGHIPENVAFLSRRLAHTERVSDKLRAQVEDLDSVEKKISVEFSRQLHIKDKQVEELADLLSQRDAEIARLSRELDEQIVQEKSYVERLKDALLKRDSGNRQIFKELSADLEKKEKEIRSLREQLLKRQELARTPAEETPLRADELQLVRKMLLEKNREMKQMESRFLRQEREHDRVLSELHKQLSAKEDNIEYMKRLFLEQQNSRKRLEQEHEESIAAKEAQLTRLEHDVRGAGRPQASLRRQLTVLQQSVSVKDSQITKLSAQLSDLDAQNKMLAKKLSNTEDVVGSSEQHYHTLLEEMKEQHHQHIRDIIRKYADQEMRLRSELQGVKARLTENTALLHEKEDAIDQTIKEFTLKYQQLLKLKGYDDSKLPDFSAKEQELREREKKVEQARLEMEQKEAKLNSLLEGAEEKIKSAIEKESGMERRERILEMEQEALKKELDVLKAAGFEISRTKDYLKNQILTGIEVKVAPEKTRGTPLREMPPAIEVSEQPVAATEVKESTFPENSGGFDASSYSEIDEIRSMLDVALQHGENEKQAKESLMRAGYDKAKVEKVLSEIKAH